jgi:hypothetical protein
LREQAITATLANDEQVSRSFMFIVQIINEEGAARSLLTFGSLQPGESVNPSVSLLPKERGAHTAEMFARTSLNSPTPRRKARDSIQHRFWIASRLKMEEFSLLFYLKYFLAC